MNTGIIEVDTETCAIPLVVPGSQVVLLQAFFELYEGPGTVRTINIRNSLICIITTPSMVSDCIEVLEALHRQIHWRYADVIEMQVVEDLFDFKTSKL